MYHDISGIFQLNETTEITGILNSSTWTISNIPNGTYNWNCLVYDNSSNSSSNFDWGNYNRSFTIGIDNNNPIINLEEPSNNSIDSNGLIIFEYNVTDSISGISNCSLIFESVLNKTDFTITESVTQGFILSDLENGNYTWRIDCTDNSDKANVGSSETRTMQVNDTSAPVIFLDKPDNGYTDKDGNVTFEYFVKDYGYGIASCDFYFNGTLNQTKTDIIEEKVQNFTLDNLDYGSYTWHVNCTDTSPNNNSGGSTIFDLDINKEPNVVTHSPEFNSTETSRDITFNYTVYDDNLIINCSLWHDINGTFLLNQTNTFVQPNHETYFYLEDVPNEITFDWNILCYDDFGNKDWGRHSNNTVTINNSAPQTNTIPALFWDEDNYLELNLSYYFSDPEGDSLTFNYTSVNNVTITITDDLVRLESEKNWFGNISVVFTAFDSAGNNVSSNNVTFMVFEGSDTKPRFTYMSPTNNSIDTDGYIFFNCSATDDLNLANISLYFNGVLNQTREVSGLWNSGSFNITGLPDGNYTWSCLAVDNASQEQWSENRGFDVSIEVELLSDIPWFVVNTSVIGIRSVVLAYSAYLNDSLTLGNFTIYEKNGEIYYSKNLSNSQKREVSWTDPPLIFNIEKFNVSSNGLFESNFTIGNKEELNFTIEYFYRNNGYDKSQNYTIEILEETP